MKRIELKAIIAQDKSLYQKKCSMFKLRQISAGFNIVYHLRLVQYWKSKKFFRVIYLWKRYWYHKLCVKYGCDIPSGLSVGHGFRIDHPIGIVINSKAIIGNNVSIKAGCVIGRTDKGIPTIGNNVFIGVHAILIGNIKVGNNVVVGAGAIVTQDVPDGATVINDHAHIK